MKGALTSSETGEAVSGPRRSVAALAALIIGDGSLDGAAARGLGERLKLPIVQSRALGFFVDAPKRLVALGHEPADAMDFVDACDSEAGEGALGDVLVPWLEGVAKAGHRGAKDALPQLRHVVAVELRSSVLRRQKPPLDGTELMNAAGLPKTAALGSAVAALKRAFRNGEFTTKEQALAWVRRKYPQG
jgi:hypothetical protein